MQHFTYKYWSTTQTKERGGNFETSEKYKKKQTLNLTLSLCKQPPLPPAGFEFFSPSLLLLKARQAGPPTFAFDFFIPEQPLRSPQNHRSSPLPPWSPFLPLSSGFFSFGLHQRRRPPSQQQQPISSTTSLGDAILRPATRTLHLWSRQTQHFLLQPTSAVAVSAHTRQPLTPLSVGVHRQQQQRQGHTLFLLHRSFNSPSSPRSSRPPPHQTFAPPAFSLWLLLLP